MTGRAGRRTRRWLAAGAAALLAAVGAAVAYAHTGDVPPGTAVLGVDLGRLDRAAAVRALRAGLPADRLAAPVPVRVAGGDRVLVRPADVALAVDVEATVAALADAPLSALAALRGSRAADPVVTVDADRLHAALRAAAAPGSRPMVRPEIRFAGGRPEPVYPEPGRGLDREVAARALRTGWLRADEVAVPLVELVPATTTADVDRLLAELATPAVAAPVEVRTPQGSFTISPVSVGQSLVLAADEAGLITPRVDERRLRTALAAQLAPLETPPVRARITVTGGAPRVVGRAGRLVDLPTLARQLLDVLPRPAPRRLAVGMVDVPVDEAARELAALGVRERVSRFTTRFDGGLSLGRSRNIVLAAREVDGALVRPGETFSLNGHTGPRGYAEGYVDAPVILDGKLVPAVGGGISQFATTLFNAAYYAGLEDVEHRPHSYWFSRYPPVIESTIFYPTLDLRFRNDTPYGVLIDTSHTADSVTVTLWSTKVYDSVRTVWGPRRDVTKPRRVELPAGPRCIATEGIDGFTQDAWRVIRQGGKEVRREKFTWRYDAEPRYVCTR